nr:hypothetical protein [Tanacetum cinerariifolium]
MTIDQQVALDEALFPHASRLRIGKSNFYLGLDITSKESTLQLVYDVLRLTPFYKAFLVIEYVPEIYMQEFWATATFHHHSICFKMENRKCIINLVYFRKMMHICPRLPGAAPPKTKASFRKTKSSSDTTITYPTATGTRLLNFAKGKQPAKASKAKSVDEGTSIILGVPDVPTEESDEEISWKSSDEDDDDNDVDERSDDQEDDDDQDEGNDDDQDTDNEGDYFVHPKLSIHEEEETKYEERFDPIIQTPKNSDDEGNDDASVGLNFGSEEGQDIEDDEDKFEEGHDIEDDEDKLYRDVNLNLEERDSSSVSSQFVKSMLNPRPNAGIDSLFEIIPQMNVPASTTVASLTLTAPTLPPLTILTKSTSAPKEKATKTTGKSTQWSKSQQKNARESAPAEELMQTTQDLEEPSHQEFEQNKTLPATHRSIQPWISDLAKQADSRSSLNELMDTPVDFLAFLMNRLKVDTLTLELLAEEVYKATTDQLDWNNPEGQQYPHNLLKPLPLIPNSRVCRVIPFDHFINNDLKYLRGSASSLKYTTYVTNTKAADYGHIKWIEDLVPHKCGVKNQDDDKLYKFKEGDIKRLRLQDIEDMLLLLRVEDLQLGVESYQKKLNLTKPDMYRSDLKRKEAYTAYSNPRGFIYNNKDKQNRLIRIAKLHKFSDGMLNNVRTTLDDRLKGIRMKYLPQAI